MAAKKKRKGTARTPPYPLYPTWSTGRYFGFLRSNIRRMWAKWPPKFDLIKERRRPAELEWISEKTGKKTAVRWEIQCDGCRKWFPQSKTQVDHKDPVGGMTHHDDLPQYVERLLCSKENLQILCTECHSKKTKEERKK